MALPIELHRFDPSQELGVRVFLLAITIGLLFEPILFILPLLPMEGEEFHDLLMRDRLVEVTESLLGLVGVAAGIDRNDPLDVNIDRLLCGLGATGGNIPPRLDFRLYAQVLWLLERVHLRLGEHELMELVGGGPALPTHHLLGGDLPQHLLGPVSLGFLL